jgi:hypothetical protein
MNSSCRKKRTTKYREQAARKGSVVITDHIFRLSDDVLDPVKNIMRAQGPRTRDDRSFQSHVVSSIISELDGDVCSRLQIPVYNAFLRLFLETRDCKDIERGLYLLAVSFPWSVCNTALTTVGYFVP